MFHALSMHALFCQVSFLFHDLNTKLMYFHLHSGCNCNQRNIGSRCTTHFIACIAAHYLTGIMRHKLMSSCISCNFYFIQSSVSVNQASSFVCSILMYSSVFHGIPNHILFWSCLCLDMFVCVVCACMKMAVFWAVALCSLVDIDQCFRGARPDVGGSKLLWNVGQYLPDCMLQHSRRQPFPYLTLWEPRIFPCVCMFA
jgi:hypothetical protein